MEEAIDSIKQARKLYIKSNIYLEDLSKEVRQNLGVTVFKFLKKFTPVLPLATLITNTIFIDVIYDTIKTDKFDGEKTAQAFTELEKYFKLLYNHPWKKEFRRLKLYSGFFNTRIKSQLSHPERIFSFVGYQIFDEGEMILTGKPNRDMVLDVCFECLVCAVICKSIELKYDEIREKGGSLLDAYEWSKTGIKPNDKILADKLKQKKSQQEKLVVNRQQNGNKENYNTISPKISPKFDYFTSDMISNHNGTDSNFIVASDIPFIDEGTHDDHIDASFREVNLKQQKQLSLPKSQEWDFVKQKQVEKPKSHDKNENKGYSVPIIDLKSRKIKTEIQRTADNRNYGTAYRTKKESSEIFMSPSVTVITLPNITQHKRSGHIAYPHVNISGNEITDSCRTQMRTKQSIENLLDVDGDFSCSSKYFDLPDSRDLRLTRSSNSSPLSDDVWSCDYCTTINNATRTVCSGCAKTLNPGPDLDSPRAGDRKKVCTICTLENHPSNNSCTACEAPLKPSNVQTYV